jgi:ATP-dependent RNA helicase DeaD
MYRIKGLKNIKPERFRANDLKELKEELLSASADRIPERIREVARELLEKRNPEEIVSLLIKKVVG